MTKSNNNGPDERAQQILRSLVTEFIRDGQPVGSKKLHATSGLSCSPATIRNVMADLEDYGFITSPHTSAGRIPTPKGYRFFVDTLVQLRQPAAKEIDELQTRISDDAALNAKVLAETASTALSSISFRQSRTTLAWGCFCFALSRGA